MLQHLKKQVSINALFLGLIIGLASLNQPAQAQRVQLFRSPDTGQHLSDMTMHFSAPFIINSGLDDVLGEKHFITVAVTGFPLESLMINLPQDMRTLEGATVTDQDGQKIAANVAITQGSIKIDFAQPVKPNNYLTVELTGVKIDRQGGTAIYRVNSVSQGLQGTIPVGTAVIQLQEQN